MFQALQEGDRVLVSRDTAGNVSMPSEIFNLSQLQEYTLNRKGELVLKKAR